MVLVLPAVLSSLMERLRILRCFENLRIEHNANGKFGDGSNTGSCTPRILWQSAIALIRVAVDDRVS